MGQDDVGGQDGAQPDGGLVPWYLRSGTSGTAAPPQADPRPTPTPAVEPARATVASPPTGPTPPPPADSPPPAQSPPPLAQPRAAQAQAPVQAAPPLAPAAPPAWAAAPQAPPPPVVGVRPSPGGNNRALLLIAAVLVAVLAAGGITWLVVGRGGDDEAGSSTAVAAPTVQDQATQPSRSAAASTQASTPSPTPTVSPEEQALQALGELRERSLQGLVLDGRWVAQVASKSVGITDPLQVAENGTHTFFAVDILAESNAARDVAPSEDVLVLQSTDFGKYSTAADGQPYWVTLVDLGFADSAAVDAWCQSTYSYMTPEERENTCGPRTLSPSYR